MEAQNQAATKIQSVYKGKKVRKDMADEKEDEEDFIN